MKKILSLPLAVLAVAAWAYDDVALVSTVALAKKVSAPAGVALAADGRVFVADRSGKIVLFGPDGAWKADWGVGAARLKAPAGMAWGPEDTLHVVDEGAGRVVVYSADGKLLRSFGQKGDRPGDLNGPTALAVAADGSVVVADTGNRRLQVFSPEGILLDLWSIPEAKAGAPIAVALVPGRRAAVLGEGETRLRFFGAGGAPAGDIPWAFSPAKLATFAPAPAGGLYVAEEVTGRVVELGPAGEERNGFGSAGTGPGQFRAFTALSARDGRLAVLDARQKRVQVFRVKPGAEKDEALPAPLGRVAPFRAGEIDLAAEDIALAGDDLLAVSQKRLFRVPSVAGKPGAPVEIKGPSGADVRGVAGRGDRVYLAEDGRKRASMIDVAGGVVTNYGVDAKGKGRLKSVAAVATDTEGRVYVADPGDGRVTAFGPDGVPLFSAAVAKPLDVAGLTQGVAVVDAQKKSVAVLDARGKTLWESTGVFVDPLSVAADLSGPQPVIYVLDAGTRRVSLWIEKNNVGWFGSEALWTNPRAVAVDGAGRVWVADQKTVKGFRVALRPAAPHGFTATAGDGALRLSWAEDAEGRTASYRLARSTRPAGAEAALGVVPSTATAFVDEDIVPGLTYYYTLTPLAASGAGPAAAASGWTARPANLPPLEIVSVDIDNVFSANYKRYADAPIGRAVVKNNTEQIFRNVKAGFTVVDFMDFTTEQVVDRLLPGARRELSLKAVFNNKILSVSEDTPLQAQLTLTYFDNGAEKTSQRTQALRLYSRNAMDWREPARLATFITPKDPPVLEFGRAVVGAFKTALEGSPLPPELARAAAVHAALGALGLSYIKDPENPFDKAQSGAAIDYVQFPRETLKRKGGDCDDLTALYAALLESLAIPTRVADLPGHVLVLVRVDTPEAQTFTTDRALRLDDGVWVPLETTRVGKSFEEAWREGARALRRVEGAPHTVNVREAWNDYAPATLPEGQTPALPLDAGLPDRLADDLTKALDVYVESAAAPLNALLAEDPRNVAALTDLALLYAVHQRWAASAEVYDRLLAVEPDNAAALNDRANLHLLAKELSPARALYEKAAERDPRDAGIQLNLARAARRLGDKAAAKKAYDRAVELSPDLKKVYASWEEAAE